MNKTKELTEFLSGVASYYRKDTSDFFFSVWLHCLADYDMETIRKAFNAYAVNPDAKGFMPSTNEILREIKGSSSDSAELAWGKSLKAVSRAGKHNDVAFDDALIHAVIEDMGGWIKFCGVTDDELPFHRLQFIKSYQAYRNRGEFPDYPRVMVGMSNLHNSANGFRCAPPLLIGDPEKATLVLENGSNGGGLRITQAAVEVARLALDKAKLSYKGAV